MYGPEGSGKTTRATAIVSWLYGTETPRLQEKVYGKKTQSASKSISTSEGNKKKNKCLRILSGSHHVQLTPSFAGIFCFFLFCCVLFSLMQIGPHLDTIVIQEIIKEIARNKAVNTSEICPQFKGTLFPILLCVVLFVFVLICRYNILRLPEDSRYIG